MKKWMFITCLFAFMRSESMQCLEECIGAGRSDVEISRVADDATCVPCSLMKDASCCCNYKSYVLALGTTAATLTFVGAILAISKDTFFARDGCAAAVETFLGACQEKVVETGIALLKGQCDSISSSEISDLSSSNSSAIATTCLELCGTVLSKCTSKWDIAATVCSAGTVATTFAATILHWLSGVARDKKKTGSSGVGMTKRTKG